MLNSIISDPREMNFDEDNWLAYREANMLFAEQVKRMVKPGDLVWVQDYHLMLLPMMLRSVLSPKRDFGVRSVNEMTKILSGLDRCFECWTQEEQTEQHIQIQQQQQPQSTTLNKNNDAEQSTHVIIGFFLHTPFPSSEIYRCELDTFFIYIYNYICNNTDPLFFTEFSQFAKKFCLDFCIVI